MLTYPKDLSFTPKEEQAKLPIITTLRLTLKLVTNYLFPPLHYTNTT